MAIKYAVATGNWSSTATWNGGTLPATTDDVYSNTFTVTIDQNVQVLSLNNGATTGVTLGGGFACSTARTINCSAGTGFNSVTGTLLANTGSVVITTLGTIANNGGVGISVGTGGTLSHTGNINSVLSNGISTSAGSVTVNITGDLSATGGTCLNMAGAGANPTVSIVGNITNNGGIPVNVVNSSSTNARITITGNVTTNSSSVGVNYQPVAAGVGSYLRIYGVLTASNTSPAVIVNNNSAASFTFGGVLIGSANGQVPFNILTGALFFLVPSAGTEIRFASSTGGTTSLYSTDQLAGPAASDVRNGVSYSYTGSTRVGTLKVPSPSYVALGIQTDDTVGTLVAPTAADIANELWNKQTTALTTSGSIGERLKNAATVDTTGAQIAANSI